ncbi:MAG: glycosyltransferase family 4 protein [Planctomycetota bacterium]
MRILFLSDNFPPETNAPATRLFEHAREWVRAGHKVTVITCAPNFPEGRVHAGHSNRWYQRESVEGIDVVRVKTFIARNEGFALRTLDYLSFMVSGFFGGLIQARHDVIVATSPQFFAAVGGWALSFARRTPFVFELRDLWPESIRAVGAVRDSFLLRVLERLELFLYARAAAIVSVTESFRDDLIARGVDGSKITVVRNGVDLSCYAPRARDAQLATQLGVEGKFVVGYVGTHGMAHALENVLDAAQLLRSRADIHFLFVGAGAARDALKSRAQAQGLCNVSFAPAQPKSAMPAVWSLCDAALIHLKGSPLFATVIPSKIFEAMGMGVPLLFAGPQGEASGIIDEHAAGLCVAAEDPKAIVAAVVRLAGDAQLRSGLAQRSRTAAAHFDRSRNASRMLDVLLALDRDSELSEVEAKTPAA